MRKLCLVALLSAALCLGMTDTPKDQHDISLDEARDLIFRFQETVSPGEVVAQFFDRTAMDQLLDQEGCAGIRYYYGKGADGEPHIVLVGVNAEGNDMLGLIMQKTIPCPPYCPGIRLDDPSLAMK